MSREGRNVMIGVRVTPAQKRALELHREATGETISEAMYRAALAMLDQIEAFYFAKSAKCADKEHMA